MRRIAVSHEALTTAHSVGGRDVRRDDSTKRTNSSQNEFAKRSGRHTASVPKCRPVVELRGDESAMTAVPS